MAMVSIVAVDCPKTTAPVNNFIAALAKHSLEAKAGLVKAEDLVWAVQAVQLVAVAAVAIATVEDLTVTLMLTFGTVTFGTVTLTAGLTLTLTVGLTVGVVTLTEAEPEAAGLATIDWSLLAFGAVVQAPKSAKVIALKVATWVLAAASPETRLTYCISLVIEEFTFL